MTLQTALLRVSVLASAGLLLARLAMAQTITELPISTAASSPGAIIAGPDGNLWFTETSPAGNIGRISSSGVIAEVPGPGFTQFSGIAAGPDGTIWLTSFYYVVRRSPSGSFASFPFGGSFCSPPSCPFLGAIAPGPDGNLWFTVSRADGPAGLYRIAPDGTFVAFGTTPPFSGNGSRLANGPDGAVWFTESLANKIGRITTTGSLMEFTSPTANSQPNGIALGPDGNLWFAESAVPKIGRITPTGTITEFASGTGLPNEIALGPDGNLWFTATAAAGLGLIGRMTPGGALTEFPIPTPYAQPAAITAGPDGDMWFTETGANKIGRITTVGPAALNTVVPCRVVDTRDSDGPVGGPALLANADRTFTLAGHCGIPEDATAVAVNLTVVTPTVAGDLRVYPGGTTLPLVSAINYAQAQIRANAAVLRLGRAGDLAVHCDQTTGSVHLVLDVSGYFK